MAGFTYRSGLGRALTYSEYDANLDKGLNVSELGAPGSNRLLYLLAAGGVAMANAVGANLTFSGGTLAVSPQGAASGLDADKLDGQHAAAFCQLANADGQSGALVAATLKITNDSGTIKHQWGAVGSPGSAGVFYAKILNAGTTLTATPTGTDGSTAMALGGKILSSLTHVFALDTADQSSVQASALSARVAYNTTGTALAILSRVSSRDINGVTRYRNELVFTDAASGANVALTSLASGKMIYVDLFGYVR